MGDKFCVGIMGGTFDPIHIGHLTMAEAVRETFGLHTVVFVPAARPPHKQGRKDIAGAEHRHIMAVLATHSNPRFTVSPVELYREGPSYSIVTVEVLRDSYGPSAEFYFITGADAVNELFTWHHAENLLRKCHFVAAERPGTKLDMDLLRSHFGDLADTQIHEIATPRLAISSTDIRQRIRQGRSIKYMVPESVEAYIYKEGLYREAHEA